MAHIDFDDFKVCYRVHAFKYAGEVVSNGPWLLMIIGKLEVNI